MIFLKTIKMCIFNVDAWSFLGLLLERMGSDGSMANSGD